jgi:hypothetical protein
MRTNPHIIWGISYPLQDTNTSYYLLLYYSITGSIAARETLTPQTDILCDLYKVVENLRTSHKPQFAHCVFFAG